MIAANVVQNVIGWAGGIALLFVFADWKWNRTRTRTSALYALVVLIPCWVLYLVAGGVGALL